MDPSKFHVCQARHETKGPLSETTSIPSACWYIGSWTQSRMSLNQPKTATIAYIAIAPRTMHATTFLLRSTDNRGAMRSYVGNVMHRLLQVAVSISFLRAPCPAIFEYTYPDDKSLRASGWAWQYIINNSCLCVGPRARAYRKMLYPCGRGNSAISDA